MNISFSIIITFFEKNHYLEKCLNEISKLETKNINFEVILVSEINFQLKSYSYNIRFIHTPNVKSPGQKRNIGVQNSNNTILAFIDDDAFPLPNWLKVAHSYFKGNLEPCCIGGPGILPTNDLPQSKIINKFFISQIFYPFPERYKSIHSKNLKNFRDWPSVNLFIPRKIFDSVGGFNPKFWPGEDSKLCNEIIKKNYKIIYLYNLIVMHYRRADFKSHIKQVFRYGFHRMKFYFNKDNNSKSLLFTIPVFFLLYFLFLPLGIVILNKIILIPLAVYLFLLIIDGFKNFEKKDKIINFFISIIIIFASHMSYGLGGLKALYNVIFEKKYNLKLKR